jgi:hypothetical protein
LQKRDYCRKGGEAYLIVKKDRSRRFKIIMLGYGIKSGGDLGVLLKRLLIACVKELLEKKAPQNVMMFLCLFYSRDYAARVLLYKYRCPYAQLSGLPD